MKRVCFYAVMLLVALSASKVPGAEPVSFTANVDRRVVDRGGQVVLTLQVSGAKPSGEPRLPDIAGLQVLSSGRSSRIEVVNGVARSSMEYRYILLPLKSGKITIPPATIEMAGKAYRTSPIEIQVMGEAESRQARRQEPYFAELTADKKTAYLDEQIILTFRFYESGVSADDFRYAPPSAKGFRMETLGGQYAEKGTAKVGGRLYSTFTIRYALFPYQSGDLTVGPAILQCTIPDTRRRTRSRSAFDDLLFFSSSRRPVRLTTEALTIRVLPLPAEGRPEGEKISVGRYSMEVSVKPKKVKVGDPVTVKAVIEGEGNIDTVAAPVIEAGSEFKKYEPSSRAEITGRSAAIVGKKTFEEILVPLSEDVKEIPAVRFTYFDTATKKYRTISRGPIPIEVLPAPEEGSLKIIELRPREKGESIRILKKDIHFIKLSPGSLVPVGRTVLSSPVFVILNLAPAACFIFLLVVTRRREKLRSDFAYARRSRAYRRATGAARKCSSLMGKSAPKEFYSSAEAVLSRYIGDRFNVSRASVTREKAVAYMRSLGLDDEAISRAERFYRDCELAQYASREYEPSEMRKSLEDLNEIVKSIEKKRR